MGKTVTQKGQFQEKIKGNTDKDKRENKMKMQVIKHEK